MQSGGKGINRWKILVVIIMIAILETVLKYTLPHNPPSPQSIITQSLPPWSFRIFTLTFVLSITLLSETLFSSVIPYLLAYYLPFLTWYAANLGNYWAIIYAVFILVPAVELTTGEDTKNPLPSEEKELEKRKSFRWVTMFWVPFQFVFLCWSCWAVSVWNLTTLEFVLFSTSVGFVTGILGINIAHELIHKTNSPVEVLLGKLLLVMVCYGHWYVEHLFGHHKMVSTPYDPASSKLGESFYRFWPRSVFGSFLSACKIEQKRLSKQKLGWWNSIIINLGVCSALLAASIYYIWGINATKMFFIQSVSAFSLLEIVNYIEHYGLERQSTGKDENGKEIYETVNPTHSWNANARITNYFLFKLQRHSDHHAYASRRYQILRSFESAPQMPTGYAGMLLMALFPPIWFWVMDPRAKAYFDQRLNLDTLEKQAATPTVKKVK